MTDLTDPPARRCAAGRSAAPWRRALTAPDPEEVTAVGERRSTATVLRELTSEGVSPWLDGVDRTVATASWMATVHRSGLRGATTNPDELVSSLRGPEYAGQLDALAGRDVGPRRAVRELAVRDVRLASEHLRGVFVGTRGRDGYVSVDLDPSLEHDAHATVAAAARLYDEVACPNVLVKIPATVEGLDAVRECLGDGIGVHVTDVFSPRRYRQVVEASFAGLERASRAGYDLSSLSSVVSLPVGLVDAETDAVLRRHPDPRAEAVRGSTAVALARLLHAESERMFAGERWRRLRAGGARTQRLMWTATGPRPPARAGYLYRLASWGTVTAATPATLLGTAACGTCQGDVLLGERAAGQAVLDALRPLGLPPDVLARRLERRGSVERARSWRRLVETVGDRVRSA